MFVGFIIGIVSLFGGVFSVLGEIFSAFMFGASIGAVVGVLQWLVLRRRVSKAGWWILASTAGLAVAFAVVYLAVAYGSPGDLDDVAAMALGGAVMGTLQWLVLRRQVSRAGWWVLASTVGWGLCGAVAAAGDDAEGMIAFVSLVGGGVVLGAVTGAALVWLLRQPVPEA